MVSSATSTFLGLNPQLSSSWIDIAWWVIPIVYAALIIWALVELVRNDSLEMVPKIAFAFLLVVAPFIGSILTIVLVRTHAKKPRHSMDAHTGPRQERVNH